MFVNHQSNHRSGHMSHALVEYAQGLYAGVLQQQFSSDRTRGIPVMDG